MKLHPPCAAVALAFVSYCNICCGGPLTSAEVEATSLNTISVKGIITPDAAGKFKSLLNSQIRTVLISSEGGVTEAALDIAEAIQRQHLDVEVIDFCASSCANYIFVAGSTKTIRPGAVVGWHGGHSFKPFRANLDSKDRLLEKEKILLREQLLYARAGTSIDLIVYSGILTLGEGDSGKVSREYTLWTPDSTEMHRLGIKNIKQSTATNMTAQEINLRLLNFGFGGQSAYTGPAYSYLPAITSKY